MARTYMEWSVRPWCHLKPTTMLRSMTTQTSPVPACSPAAPEITDAMVAQFQDEGYVVLERVIGEEDLELLRSAAEFSMEHLDREMDAAGVDRLGINARGKRYFSPMVYQQRPELRSFIFGPVTEQICRRLLGENAYLF